MNDKLSVKDSYLLKSLLGHAIATTLMTGHQWVVIYVKPRLLDQLADEVRGQIMQEDRWHGDCVMGWPWLPINEQGEHLLVVGDELTPYCVVIDEQEGGYRSMRMPEGVQ